GAGTFEAMPPASVQPWAREIRVPERAVKCPCVWIFLRVGAVPGGKEGVYLPSPLGEVRGTGPGRSRPLWLWKEPSGPGPEDPRGRPLPVLGRTRPDRGRRIDRGRAVAGIPVRPRRGVQRFPSVRPRDRKSVV